MPIQNRKTPRGSARSIAGLAGIYFEEEGGGFLEVAAGEGEDDGRYGGGQIVDDGGAGQGVECIPGINENQQ